MTEVTGIHFISEATGYIFNFNKEMYKTTDGGVTWNLVSQNIPDSYAQPYFAHETNGVIATPDAIHHTSDGGTTWQKDYDAPATISRMRFVSKTTGFFVGNEGLIGRIDLKYSK